MRTRRERIRNTYKKIRRKLRLLKVTHELSYTGETSYSGGVQEFIDQPHRLAKDTYEDRRKEHTNNKTKRHMYGNYQKSRNYSPKDQRQIDAGDYNE